MTNKRFERYVWVILAYTMVVILWGAFVRATGSGAGCGNHWPLCNGEVIPREPMIETIIEISHRITSGFLLILIAAMVFIGFRTYPKGHIVRKGAVATLVFVIIEALIGAFIVLYELVADNASMARAYSMSLHLVNTLLLLAAIILTGLWVRGVRPPTLNVPRAAKIWTVIGVLMMMLLGASGGIAALGDTLFPAVTFAEGLKQELDPTSNLLLRLRVAHPAIAVGTGLVMVMVAQAFAAMRQNVATKRLAWLLYGTYGLQLLLGTLNVILLAPVWLQLVHLLLSDVIWFAFVALAAHSFERDEVDIPAAAT
jgi:heme A synthase